MGIRADFYVGRGADAEWLGSVAWDGYPGSPGLHQVLASTDERDFRLLVGDLIAERSDGTFPEHGWPWPWADSHTTDWAYTIDDGTVYVSSFGQPWVAVDEYLGWDEASQDAYRNDRMPDDQKPVFPDMRGIQNATLGPRSGVTVVGDTPEDVDVIDDKREQDERRGEDA